jgi:HEAT repeat protein
MLDGLDKIDWGSLHHATGPAIDVPGNIRALASTDKKVREEALSELFGTIWQKGTVYEASAPAVPFLIELLREPSVEAKIEILDLLACLASASPHIDIHSRDNSDVDQSPRRTPGFEEKLAREVRWVQAAHDAVEAGAPVYLELLDNDDCWETRLAAANVLGRCVAHREICAAALLDSFSRETDPRVHFGLLLCLGGVARAEDEEFLKAIIGSEPDPHVFLDSSVPPPSPGFLRWAAAVALARLKGENTPIEAIRILEETLTNPEPIGDFLNEMPWAAPGAIALACSALSLLPAETAVPVLVDALEVVPQDDVPTVMWRLLELAFPELEFYSGDHPHGVRTPTDLSPLQHHTLEALVANNEAWSGSWNLDLSLRRLGLPERREELRAFLKIEAQDR